MHNNKKILLLGIMVLAAVLVLSGCKSADEKAAEKIIENATNGAADVDISTNTVTVNTNGYSYQVGDQVTLPADFPKDIYIIDGKLTLSSKTAQSNGFTVSLDITKTVAEAKALYDSHLVSDGWAVTSSASFENSAIIYASKGDRALSLGINKGEAKNTVAITTYTNTATNTNPADNTNTNI